MVGRLPNLRFAATGRMLVNQLALIVSILCFLQVTASRAAATEQLHDDSILPAPAITVAYQAPAEYDPPLAKLPSVVDEATAQMVSAASDPLPSPPSGSASSHPQSLASTTSAKSTWIPQGMIPYIGPRTPDVEKDRGIGGPLGDDGWRTRPFSISGFSGFTAGGALIPGHVNQQPSYYGGLNFGWDYDHYWGFEKRLGFGALRLTDGHHDPIGGTNLSITGEYRLMYYPLGDAHWRPFVTSGLGWSDFYFNDDLGDKHLDTVGMVPFGLGVKYLHNQNLALRIDLIDELTIGAGSLSTFHYVALTAGLEVHYGRRLLKMPWHRDDAGEH